jgi:hypothetical protein
MDVVVTVPKGQWAHWIDEGALPDQASDVEYHFWIAANSLPDISPGDRVYVVAHGRLRGYAPLVRVERRCRMRPWSACLVRTGGAVAVTIPEEIRGFQGWRYRWWACDQERPFPDWLNPRAAAMPRAQAAMW